MIRAIEVKANGEPVNLGNGDAVVTINELAETIIDISGKDIAIEHNCSKPTGTDKYAADTSRMTTALNWQPQVTLGAGVRRVYAWAETELNTDIDSRSHSYADVPQEEEVTAHD
jgi:UDP-glucose 4-epimerase